MVSSCAQRARPPLVLDPPVPYHARMDGGDRLENVCDTIASSRPRAIAAATRVAGAFASGRSVARTIFMIVGDCMARARRADRRAPLTPVHAQWLRRSDARNSCRSIVHGALDHARPSDPSLISRPCGIRPAVGGSMEHVQIQVKPKILVVDDNTENLALARATLEDEGFDVIVAVTGDHGVRAFEDEHPDCVLLDIRMPGTDGFAVCSRIRDLPDGANTPIIFLTALRDVDTFDRALRVGGDEFLTKPVSPAELVLRVKGVLKLRRMSTELREQYELVRHQRDHLMRLQLQKERLTAFVVHDLKNPLNAMDLNAQVLLRNPELSPRARASVQNIREGARSLLRLILNLLDISKSEEGQLAPRHVEVDLGTLVAEVLEVHLLKAQAAGVTLEQTMETRKLRADVDLLRRIIENLLDNAIRHAPKLSKIRVGALWHEDAVEIRVADAGPGISPELREKIFERFVQVEASEQVVSTTGRGLGLAFCKLAVEAHGGTIWIEEGNPGAVFCLRLPS